MAQYTKLAAVLNGLVQNVDLASNELAVNIITVGGASGTQLTKTILDSLIANSHASGSDNQDVVAGAGLTGGGTGATTTLNVGAGSGISVAADSVAVDSTVVRTNGANAFSANQSMGGNKLTNLAAPTANGDALRYDQLGAAGGIATLDGGGKIPVSQLPNSVMEYQGNWNASTNSPTLADGTGNAGDVYRVNVAGTQDLGSGSQTYAVGDWAVYNGTIWQRSQNSDSVVSVNGSTGVVTVNAINQLTGDVTASAASGSQSKATTVAAIQGTTVSGTTGTGNVVFSASPTLTGTLSAAAISASGSVTGSNLSGTNTGDQTITLTGDVTGSGTGSFATTIGAGKVTASMLATVTDGTSLDQAGAGSTLEIKNAGVTLAKLAADSVDESKIKSSSHDGSLAGGSGTVLSVNYAPAAVKTMVAGEAFAANTSFLVRMAVSGETAGRVYKADQTSAASAGKFWALGMAMSTSAVSAGQNIDVTLLGTHTLGSSNTAFSSGDIGKAIWLSSSTGGFSITAPTTSGEATYKIGVVETTTKAFIDGKQFTGIN